MTNDCSRHQHTNEHHGTNLFSTSSPSSAEERQHHDSSSSIKRTMTNEEVSRERQPPNTNTVTPDDDPTLLESDVTEHYGHASIQPTTTAGNSSEDNAEQEQEAVATSTKKKQDEEDVAFQHQTTPPATSSSSRIGRIYRKTSRDIRTAHSAHNAPSSRLSIEYEDYVNDDSHRQDDDEHDERRLQQQEATWKDVMVACCCHSALEWFWISIGVLLLLFSLYFFLLGLELLGTSFKVVGGCTAGSLLGSDTNPLASVMIGILATAILQSSSTTTAIIVTLVDGGLDVVQGIYMVMGANVGTSVTSMIVSLAHMGDGEELERAFAASSVLYLFNLLTLVILFPLEITTHYLYRLTALMLPTSVGEGEAWEGPIKRIVSPLGNKIIIANKHVIESVADGASCESFYPVSCQGDVESYATCQEGMGLIACDKKTNKCPAFFQNGATKRDDMVSGWVCLFVALFMLIICLLGVVALLRRMLAGASTRVLYRATNINPYLSMLIGCGITVLVQSSSITTSVLVPLAGIGVLSLEQVYPLVLGANTGTTFTALMAAMVSSKVESLQIALVHLFYNVTGTVIWYPIPFMRRVPLRLARKVGKVTAAWRNFPILFIVIMFFVLPLLLLGISACFEQHTAGFTALGVFLLILMGGGILYFWIWWRFRDGKAKCRSCIRRRQRRSAAVRQLADDMDYLKVDMEYVKNEIGRLKDYAGLPRLEEEGRVPPAPSSEALRRLEEELVSLYHSVQSQPWSEVLAMAGEAVPSSFHSMIGPSSLHSMIGSSGRGTRRGGDIGSSTRGSRRRINPMALGSSTRSTTRNVAFGGSDAIGSSVRSAKRSAR